jgi:hypothetical protein
MCNNRSLQLLLLAFILLTSCAESSLNEDMPASKLISIKIPANYYSYYNQAFYFINSMDGELLSSKKLSINEEDIFEVNRVDNEPYDRFTFTRMFVKENSSIPYITLTTYVGILPFSKDYTQTTSPPTYTYLGQATVNFSNIPAYSEFLLSSTMKNYTTGDLTTGSFNFPIYTNINSGLFIRIYTSSGDKYKFIENLTPNSTITIDLSIMNSDFTTTEIDLNNSISYTDYFIYLDKYQNSDFTSNSFTVFSKYTNNNNVSIVNPQSFLPNSNYRIDLDCFGSDYYSYGSYYSKHIPEVISPVWVYFSLQSAFPKLEYLFDISDEADNLSLTWRHSSSFEDNNGYRVIWYVYFSPSIREYSIPGIPASILDQLYYEYGIYDLSLSEMESQYLRIDCSSRAKDYDEFMKNYWFGWKDPIEGTYDVQVNYYPNSTKGATKKDLHERHENPDTDKGF